MADLKVTLTRGLAGKRKDQKLVAESLGLRKRNSSKIHPDNEATRGKIAKISHLIHVEEV